MKQAEGAQHVEIKKARASCMERQAKGYRFNGRDPYRFKNTGGSRDKTKQKRTDRSCVTFPCVPCVSRLPPVHSIARFGTRSKSQT